MSITKRLCVRPGSRSRHPLAEEQVAFPVAGHRPVVGLGGPFADVERAAELALAVHHRVAQRPAGGVSAAQIAGQLLAQRASGLHEQRQVDRLVRHAHLRVVGELHQQPPRDLLRRPAQLELRLDHRPQPLTGRQLRWLRAPSPPQRSHISRQARYRRRPPLHLDLTSHRRRRPPKPAAITRSDSPPASPREISSRSANDNRNGERRRAGTGGWRNFTTHAHTARWLRPISFAISRPGSPVAANSAIRARSTSVNRVPKATTTSHVDRTHHRLVLR